MKIQDLLATTVSRLEACSETPRLDAQVLLAHIIQKPRVWVIAHPESYIKKDKQDCLELALKRLEAGEPLPYILGKWEFFGLEFDITKDVLIPRPETELLVEKAIDWLTAHPEKRNVADIGTGSGAIAISIASHIPDAHILATDISPAALQVAKHNAEKFNVQDQIDFLECDLLPEPKAKSQRSDLRFLTLDLLCSNPPYIPTETLQQLPIFGREPTLALDGGADGLNIYRRLFKLTSDWLAPQGMILLETEATLGVQVLSLAYDSFSDVSIHLHQDLAGCDRLVDIQLHE
jgi:release factor glutamine methyltransferase